MVTREVKETGSRQRDEGNSYDDLLEYATLRCYMSASSLVLLISDGKRESGGT